MTKNLTAENFNNFFVNIGPKRAAKIDPTTQNFNIFNTLIVNDFQEQFIR